MNALFAQNLLVLFAILAIGSWIGQLSFKGLSLGTAGVLFTALVFGHFGFSVPKEIMNWACCYSSTPLGCKPGHGSSVHSRNMAYNSS